MPYIREYDRKKFAAGIKTLGVALESVGELNYIISMLTHLYIQKHGRSYKTFNDAMGVLECAKTELYRRHIAPYEDTKIEENGDI